MKCKISCPVHNNDKREWEIGADGRVWPCCYFGNGWDKRHRKNEDTDLLFSDEKIREQFNKDPEWNSLNTYDLNTILDNEIFWTHIYNQGWESDEPPVMCVKECSVITDNVSGKQLGGSSINVRQVLRGDNENE